jgi:hypothetical protein
VRRSIRLVVAREVHPRATTRPATGDFQIAPARDGRD